MGHLGVRSSAIFTSARLVLFRAVVLRTVFFASLILPRDATDT